MTYLLLFFLLLASAFFNASEITFFAIKGQPGLLIKNKKITELVTHPLKLLSVILLGNDLVNVAFSAIGTIVILSLWGETYLAYGTLILTLIIIVFAEILPKTFSATFYLSVAEYLSGPLYFFSHLMGPISSFFDSLAENILRSFFKGEEEKKPPLTSDELRILVQESVKEGLFSQEEEDLISKTVELEVRTAGEIMTPRTMMVAEEESASIEEVIKTFLSSGVSRLPLYRGSLDQITGILYVKDFVSEMAKRKDFLPASLKRPALFIPESVILTALLEEFRQQKTHIAIVVDEYGGCAGVVSLEDLLEELVGEIWDEYDTIPFPGRGIAPGIYLLPAASERRVLERIGLNIPEEYPTLSSFLIELWGKIPTRGEEIEYQGWKFTVEEAKANRIETVRVEKCLS